MDCHHIAVMQMILAVTLAAAVEKMEVVAVVGLHSGRRCLPNPRRKTWYMLTTMKRIKNTAQETIKH